MNATRQDTDNTAPAYVSRLGLNRAPFAQAVDDDFFCADSTLSQRLEMMRHLTEFGALLLLVIGERGSGKTTLLRQLVNGAGSNWRVCTLEADASTGADVLLRDLATSFGAADAENGAPAERLASQLTQLIRQNQLPVLVIDDAHNLSATALQGLLDLEARGQGEDKLLRLVLFGDASLETRMSAASDVQQQHMHTITVPRLSELQTAAYIQHRLEVAGLSGESPLTPANIKNIHKATQGLPALINERANQMLLDIVSRGGRFATKDSGPEDSDAQRGGGTRRLALLVAALGVIAILAAVFKPWENDELSREAAEPETVELTLPQLTPSEPDTAMPADEPDAASSISPQPVAPPPPPAPAATLSEIQAPERASNQGEIALSNTPPVEIPETPSVPPVAAPVPTPEPAPPSPPSTETAPTATGDIAPAAPSVPKQAETSPPPSTVAAPVNKPAPATTGAMHQDDWLLARPDDHYTLQLIGTRKQTAIQGYIRQHDLKGELAILHTIHQGDDWYVLLYGDFAGRTAAFRALDTLPAAVRKGGPWARTYATVHADIAKRKAAGR